MKRLSIMLLVISGFLCITQEGWATKAYVTDAFEITLRTGPSNENKIVAMLFSGRPLEVVSTQGEWSQVKVLDGDKEGWVMTRYVITRLPWEVQAKRMQDDVVALSGRLSRVQKELADESQQRQNLATELKKKTDELEALGRQYAELKKGADGYLKLKSLYETTEKNMNAARAELGKLAAENESLQTSQQNRWFLSGALVLLCGLLIGGLLGRQQKKRRSLYT